MEDLNEMPVQYLGWSGYSRMCLDAMAAILNSGAPPDGVAIITYMHDRKNLRADHLFLFWNWSYFPVTIVPSGFYSGPAYGEGAKSFSAAICMIESKGIPIENIEVGRDAFEAIDQGKVSTKNLLRLKSQGESLTFDQLADMFVFPEHRALLESGKIWRVPYYRGPSPDIVTGAIAEIDDYHTEVGKLLRKALDKSGLRDVEDWQETGILVRDAWIELLRKMCANIDTDDIKRDDVKGMLNKLKIDDRISKLAASVFDLSKKVQHDRRGSQEVAKACVVSSIFSMRMLLPKSEND